MIAAECPGADSSALLSVEIAAVRFESDGPDMLAVRCNDSPERAQAFGVYIRNPQAFHVADYPCAGAADRERAFAEAFAFAGALAEHIGGHVEACRSA